MTVVGVEHVSDVGGHVDDYEFLMHNMGLDGDCDETITSCRCFNSLEFVSIRQVINHMTCYKSSALIGGKFIYKKILYKICSPV